MTGVAVLTAGLATHTASAAPATSTLEATPTAHTFDAPILVDGENEGDPQVFSNPQSVDITAALDAACAQALSTGTNNGLAYKVLATTSDATVVTVSPAESAKLKCDGHTGDLPTSTTVTATLAETAEECDSATIRLEPVVQNPGAKSPRGQQNRVAGTTVAIDVDGEDCGIDGNEPGSSNPAAPAVANAYLNLDNKTSVLWTECAKRFKTKNDTLWRGALIKGIADWMPKPESIKDRADVAPIWVAYVRHEVNVRCGIPADGVPPDPAEFPGLSAYSS